MKRILITIVLLVTIPSLAQKLPTLKGSRQVERYAERLDFFREVVLEGDIEIELLPGITPRFELVADDNIKDVMSIEVRDEVLYIDLYYRITRAKSLTMKVFYTELDHIRVKVGEVVVPEVLTPETLTLEVADRCSLEAQANVRRAEVRLEGSARLKFNVDADALLVEARGNSTARIYATAEENRISLDEYASFELEGTGDRLELKQLGNSRFRGFGFQTKVAEVELDQNPDANLFITDRLTLNSQGRSRTEFYGEPAITINRFLNQSQLIKRELKDTE